MDERIARIQERVRATSAPALRQWLEEAEPPADGNKRKWNQVDPRAANGVDRANRPAIEVEMRPRPPEEMAVTAKNAQSPGNPGEASGIGFEAADGAPGETSGEGQGLEAGFEFRTINEEV